MTDHIATDDQPTSGALLLAEVIYAVEQLAQESSSYPAIYDLAVTCDQSGFFESSLILYDRCLRIAATGSPVLMGIADKLATAGAAKASKS